MGVEAITDGFYDRLAGDGALAALLASHYDDASKPGIYTTEPVPDDAPMPYVVMDGDVSGSGWDTKTSEGLQGVRDLRCYAQALGDSRTIEQIADRVRLLFHRQHRVVVFAGYTTVVLDCGVPLAIPTSREYYGRVVSCRYEVMG